MSRQIAFKYVLPIAGVALLVLLAAWAFRLPPVSALTGRDAPAAVEPLAPSPERSYAFDVISVSGYGRVVGTPDQAHMSIEVSVLDDTVAEARGTMAATTEAVLTALRDNGIADADMATSHLSIYEEFDWTESGRKSKGFRVSNGLSVKVRNIDNVGAVIDAAIAAGGDYTRFNGLSFGFSDTVRANMERKARQLAVQNMRNKAVQLASFGGRNIGLLREVSETDYGVGAVAESLGRGVAAAAASFDAAPTPILPGESEITVFVAGVYELR